MDRIRLPKPNTKPKLDPSRKPKPRSDTSTQRSDIPKPRDELAESVTNMGQLGEFVHTIRTSLSIGQAELARRADVGRNWLGELEHGKPTLEAQMVLRVLLALGFEVVLSPYDPPPPWMLRACAFASAKEKARVEARRVQRNTRRARARMRRLSANAQAMLVDVE